MVSSTTMPTSTTRKMIINKTSQFTLITSQRMNTNKMFFLFTLYVLCFQIVHAQSCVTLTASQSSKICQICNKNQFQSCKQTLESGTVQKLTQSQCRQRCCNSSIYKDSIKQSFCNQYTASKEQDISPVTLILVVSLSIPILILLFCILVRCLRAPKIEDLQDCPVTNESLQKMNKDELGPQIQERKIVCSICLQEDCNIRTICGHSYHSQCFIAWISQKNSCPLCLTYKPEPVILYCTHCFKSQALALLPKQSDGKLQHNKQWRRYSSIQCHSCRYRQLGIVELQDMQISLSDSKTTRKQYKPAMPQSSTKIMPQK